MFVHLSKGGLGRLGDDAVARQLVLDARLRRGRAQLVGKKLVRERDLAHGHGLAQQQAHLLFPLIRCEPAQGALLALAQRHPVFDLGRLERVQQVVALEGQIRLKDEYGLRVAEDRDAPNR